MQSNFKNEIQFSDEEIICIYTALCALPNLNPEYWNLKEKIETHIRSKTTIEDIVKIQHNATCIFTCVNKEKKTDEN